MGFYGKYILPKVLNFTCGSAVVRSQRQKVVPLAEGRVLEIGIGSGLNLPFYDPAKVERVIGLDPAEEMLAYARRKSEGLTFTVEYLMLEGERIPLERGSVDSVLVTYTLCTIPDPIAALEGMRRVLKPAGRLIFCEHGRAPDEGVRRWQHRLNPVWNRIGGGCNLDRDIPGLIESAGFRVDSLSSMYLPNTPRFAGFNYWGTARPS
ncbi:MAG: methyltransferase domain-containing protein [Kiloniellales bacterium]